MRARTSLFCLGIAVLAIANASAQEAVQATVKRLSFADRLQSAKFVSLTELSNQSGSGLIRSLHVYPDAEWKKRTAARAEYDTKSREYRTRQEASREKMTDAQQRNARDEYELLRQAHEQIPRPTDPYQGHTFYEVVTVGEDFLELRQPGKPEFATLLLSFGKIDKVYWHPQPQAATP